MSLDACAELVRRGDPDRWMSLMAVDVDARAKLLPLYAFNLEVARAPWVSREPLIAQMRLQWWRDALTEIAEGGPVRRHEVVTPLDAVLPQDAARDLDTLVLARHKDIEIRPFDDLADLRAYLDETGGGLVRAAAVCLGGATRGSEAAGAAGATAAYLRALAELKGRGRVPLPEMTAEAVGELAEYGQAQWRLAKEARPDPKVRPALLALWRTPALLAAAARAPDRVLTEGLDTSPARRHLSLLWRQWAGTW
ncbi:MAG: squalene/phytoene synthase family protein [Pseudomonadota bacterium]